MSPGMVIQKDLEGSSSLTSTPSLFASSYPLVIAASTPLRAEGLLACWLDVFDVVHGLAQVRELLVHPPTRPFEAFAAAAWLNAATRARRRGAVVWSYKTSLIRSIPESSPHPGITEGRKASHPLHAEAFTTIECVGSRPRLASSGHGRSASARSVSRNRTRGRHRQEPRPPQRPEEAQPDEDDVGASEPSPESGREDDPREKAQRRPEPGAKDKPGIEAEHDPPRDPEQAVDTRTSAENGGPISEPWFAMVEENSRAVRWISSVSARL
jgi:hypothetical protein